MSIDNNKAAMPDPAAFSSLQPDVADEIRQKLEWFDYYEKHERNARLVCRHFGISPDTFYRWKKRYDSNNLSSLADNKKSRRPKKLRESAIPLKAVQRIKELREAYPSWGRNKLLILLKNEGVSISAATIGRIIKQLKKLGLLHDSKMSRITDRQKAGVGRKLSLGFEDYLTLLNVWKK